MAKPGKHLLIGSLQPLLFCIGMYMVVLIASVFICASVYRTLHPQKRSVNLGLETSKPAPAGGKQTIARL